MRLTWRSVRTAFTYAWFSAVMAGLGVTTIHAQGESHRTAIAVQQGIERFQLRQCRVLRTLVGPDSPASTGAYGRSLREAAADLYKDYRCPGTVSLPGP